MNRENNPTRMKAEKYVPNNVYRFDLSLNIEDISVTIPTKIVKDDGWIRIDEFNNDEDAIIKAYFTQERINEYKKELIKKIESLDNPFHIYCNDKDGDYNFTEEQLFRK